MIQQITASVIFEKGYRITDWWDVGTHSDGLYDFAVPYDRQGNPATTQLLFEFTLDETQPHPERGADYLILSRAVEARDGQEMDFPLDPQ